MSETKKHKYVEVRDKVIYELLNGRKFTHHFKDGEPKYTASTMTIEGTTFKKKDIHKFTLHYKEECNQKPFILVMHMKVVKNV